MFLKGNKNVYNSYKKLITRKKNPSQKLSVCTIDKSNSVKRQSVVTKFGSRYNPSKHVPIMIITIIYSVDVCGIVLYYGKVYYGQQMR